MSNGIVLSSSIRTSLTTLQGTADLQAKTQERLATGKKVNSALDNPTNFFTAAGLNRRANELSALLDGMSNGVKTLQAADNGMKSITRTVESLQANIRQARADKSFKAISYALDAGRTGNLSFSGGGVGTNPVNIALGSTATATTLAGTGANFATNFTGGNVTVNGTTAAIRGDQAAVATTLAGAGANFATNFTGGNVTVNGTTAAIRGDVTAVASSATGTGSVDLTGDPDLSALDGESVTLTATNGSTTTYSFTNAASGQGAALDSALAANGFTVTRTANGLDVSRADGVEFTVATTNAAVDTAIGIANNTATTNGTEAFDATATTVAADLNGAGVTGLTATVNGGQVDLSLASGADITLGGGGTLLTAIGYGSGNQSSTNGTEAFDATAATVAADLNGAGVTGLTATVNGGQVDLSLASGQDLTLGGGGTLLTALGYGSGNQSSTSGDPAALSTVDQLVTAINANSTLAGKVKATNDGGKLRIENLSTENLTLGGVGSDGEVDGSAGTGTIGGNEVRKNLQTQFNELRRQLDKLAEDASYNGINLLKADKLKITFNETGNNLEIQAKNTAGTVRGINTESDSLNIGEATAAEFSDDTLLDQRYDKLRDSLTTLQTQASSFGSSLTTMEIRQEFTQATINTLRGGADNLTLADLNEEGANLLALNTRQQIAQTSLSFASQAQQAVLRLF